MHDKYNCFKLIAEKILESNENEVFVISTPRKEMYILKSNDGSIYEIIQINEKNRCFFIDNTVSSNGKMYMTSKIDPLFIFIQLLEANCKEKAQPLDQLLEGNLIVLQDYLKLNQMKMIANQKGPDDLKAFVFDEEKTLKWLKIKFARIQDSLRKLNIISVGSTSLNFVDSSSKKNDVENEDEIATNALGIISEYISLNLYEKLDSFYGISEKSKEPIAQQKRKSNTKSNNEPDSKKIKSEPEETLKENYITKPPPSSKIVAKNAKLEKAAKGSKSISSFFTKK